MTRQGNIENQTQSALGPSWMEGTNQEARFCHARPRRSLSVNDAGARAPVVFSDDQNAQTCKIRGIEAKERPILHNSTLLSPMALLVLIENGCIAQFEGKNINCPNNGKWRSGR